MKNNKKCYEVGFWNRMRKNVYNEICNINFVYHNLSYKILWMTAFILFDTREAAELAKKRVEILGVYYIKVEQCVLFVILTYKGIFKSF